MTKIPEIVISVKYKKKVPYDQMYTLVNSDSTANLLRQLYDKNTIEWREEMILLCLNRANKVLGSYKLSVGGLSQTVVDPRVILTVALNTGACNIILSHNHPSGNVSPSEADLSMTKRIKSAADLFDIKILDHVIITADSYYSMCDEGNL